MEGIEMSAEAVANNLVMGIARTLKYRWTVANHRNACARCLSIDGKILNGEEIYNLAQCENEKCFCTIECINKGKELK